MVCAFGDESKVWWDPVSCHITISGEFRIGLCNDDMYKQDVVRCMQCFMNVCDIRMRHVLEGLSFQVPGVKCNSQ